MFEFIIGDLFGVDEIVCCLYFAVDIVKSVLEILSVVDGQELFLYNFQDIFFEFVVYFLEKAA